MNYITNFFRVGCVALLAMLVLAPGAFAQQDPPTAPNPPTDVEAVAGDASDATAAQQGRITLTWSPVTGDDNGGFDVPLTAAGYQIEASSDYDAANPTAATWAVATGVTVTPANPTGDPAVPKFTAVHVLPEESDGDAETASYNLTRHYRVSAINVIGTGNPSAVAMATTHNVPDPPTDLMAVAGDPTAANPQEGRITITWSPIDAANNGGMAVANTAGSGTTGGYILEFFDTTADPQAWTEITSGITNADPAGDPAVPKFTAVHDLSSLTEPPGGNAGAGITRKYRVRAVNAAGAGENSGEVSGTTHDVPAAPTGLTVGDVTVNSSTATQNDIAVSWNAVPDASNGGLAITGYNVEFLVDPPGTAWADATGGTPVAHAAGTIETTHAGLDEATGDPPAYETYYYRVRAVSAAGNGDWSATSTGVKLAPPGAASELTVTAVDQQDAIDLFWKAPENTGEPAVTGYKIERAVDYDGTVDPPTATWTTLQANWSGRAFRDRDLTNPDDGTAYAEGTTFTYQVSAVNVVGEGSPSNADGAISSNKALKPRNLTATVADDMESIVLSWDGPVADEDNPANGGSPITGYKIEVSTDAGATWADVDEDMAVHPESGLLTGLPGSEFAYTHEDVAAGTSYIYRVSAVNDAGPGQVSDASASVSIDAGVPDAPTGLTAMAAADADGIELSWSAPVATGGSDITAYNIEVSEDYDSADPTAATWTELDITITDPDPMATPPTTMFSAVHTGLTPGATYHYRVSATNSAGTGEFSAIANAVAPDIPGAPTGLTATADGENTINLSWTAPEVATGASAIAGYKIESSPDGTDGSWTDLVANTGDTEVTHSDTDLDPATTRHYRVSAINGAGSTGSPSNVANATTAARGTVMRYAVSEDGSTSGTCTNAANPCTLEAALDASVSSDNDLILVRIRRVGETATIGDATMINKMVTLGVYVRGTSAAAKGAVSFTGSVELADGGDLMTHKDASVHFDELEVSGMSSIDKLTVRDDLTISEDDDDNTMTSVLAVDELTVNSGQTLTLGNGANVRARLTKGAVGKMNGKLDVKGTIDGMGDLWIAHTADERAADGFMLHEPGDYRPDEVVGTSKNKFTADDCLMVTGGGTVENDLHIVAAGNVCVILGEVGNLNAVGSISGQDDITTDVIFRNGVTVNGDVMQWNDARVSFEKSAMIEGDVTLDYGDGGVGTDFGTPISAPADFERAMGSGVEFGGESNTIEGDLNLKFDGESGSTEVLLNVPMSGGTHMTTVEGDLIIEDGGGIDLHGDPGDKDDKNDNPRTHNLSAEGDVFVYSDAEITQEHAAMSSIEDGLCSAPGLKFGTKVMLSGDVVFTEGATLTIATVVIADDVEVEEEGSLIATTVHINEDGELDSDGNVQITDALVLQGDGLEGSLAAGSTVNKLTYATVDSDEIDMGATVANLSVNVGADRELRISEAVTVTNLGLCSGTLVLIDTDTEANTLTVTELLTVDDGSMGLDSNRPGSAGTDVSKPNAAATDGYILLYVTAGERMAGSEWFAPRKVAVNHKDAVIMVGEAKSLVEGVHIFNGELHMTGEGSNLTVGMPSSLSGISPFVMVDNGGLHSNGSNVIVHGTVVVATGDKEVGAINTGGGELHVLGQNPKGVYTNGSAVATVGIGGTIDVGMGMLQLGPAYTEAGNGLAGADRPDVTLTLTKTDKGAGKMMGTVYVPRGSKETSLNGEVFDTVVLDAAGNPKKDAKGADNWGGGLYFHDSKVTIDSLAAMNDGAIEFL